MDLADRLAALCNERGLTRQAPTDVVQVPLTRIEREATGERLSLPDVIRRLNIALSVATDKRVAGKGERDPDDDPRRRFEAIGQLSDTDSELARGQREGPVPEQRAKREACVAAPELLVPAGKAAGNRAAARA